MLKLKKEFPMRIEKQNLENHYIMELDSTDSTTNLEHEKRNTEEMIKKIVIKKRESITFTKEPRLGKLSS